MFCVSIAGTKSVGPFNEDNYINIMWHLSVSRSHGYAPKCYPQLMLAAQFLLHLKTLSLDLTVFFVSFEHASTQRQASVSSLLTTVLGVNLVSNVSNRWRRLSHLSKSMSIALISLLQTFLKQRWDRPSDLLPGGQFLIQKNFKNPPISRHLLLVFYRHVKVSL